MMCNVHHFSGHCCTMQREIYLYINIRLCIVSYIAVATEVANIIVHDQQCGASICRKRWSGRDGVGGLWEAEAEGWAR